MGTLTESYKFRLTYIFLETPQVFGYGLNTTFMLGLTFLRQLINPLGSIIPQSVYQLVDFFNVVIMHGLLLENNNTISFYFFIL
jgi:hypothetical protein